MPSSLKGNTRFDIRFGADIADSVFVGPKANITDDGFLANILLERLQLEHLRTPTHVRRRQVPPNTSSQWSKPALAFRRTIFLPRNASTRLRYSYVSVNSLSVSQKTYSISVTRSRMYRAVRCYPFRPTCKGCVVSRLPMGAVTFLLKLAQIALDAAASARRPSFSKIATNCPCSSRS